jgi:hypothetical protein
MSSYVIAASETFAVATEDLAGIGEGIKGAFAVAAPSTTGIVVAAGDQVSAAIAGLFGGYAQEFQTLSALTATFHAQFVGTLSAAGAAYAAAEAVAASSLRPLELEAQGVANLLAERLTGHPLFGTGTAGAVSTGGTGAVPGPNYGVTGVRQGFSILNIPVGPFNVFGHEIGPFNFPAPARWYFPTQADGSVHANDVIYLQHGFGVTGWFYGPLAAQLAVQTDSIVVVPTLPFIPLPLGLWLGGATMQHGVASLFLGNETALNFSAHHAGYQGTLPQKFFLAGHSAGGGLATIAAGDYIADLGANTAANHLEGVVMFDGVANNSQAFAAAIANLKALNIPDYVVAAPPQQWNAFGATTNQLASLYPGQFVGVELLNGSHVDSMMGRNPVTDFILQLVTGFSPPGNTAAVYNLSTGWINDMFTGHGPTDPMYGIYGATGGYVPPGGQRIILGPATGIVLPV